MLNKDDKSYIRDKISGSVKKSEKSLKEYIHEAIRKSETKLEEKIHINGLKIDRLEELVLSIAESQATTNKKLDDLIVRFDRAFVDNFPIAWEKLKDHDKRITKLEAKAA